MRISRYSALCLSVAVVACMKSGDKTVDTAAATTAVAPAGAPMTPAPTMISLSSVAGTWHFVSTPTEGKDTSSTKYTMKAAGDTTGWTLNFAGRKPIPLHVMTSGDSIIATSDKYESVRRKGVKVATMSVFRLQGDKLVGTTVAHYDTKGPDSVLHLQSVGTKAP
jgi:hypothetical protein